MFVSVSIYLLVESPVTSFPWMEARSCLRVSTTTTIIITRVGKPSRTIDLLGPSFLIHAETSKGVNSTIGMCFWVQNMFCEGLEAPNGYFMLKRGSQGFWSYDVRSHGQSLRTHVRLCVLNVEGRIRFLVPFELRFLHQGFSMIPMTQRIIQGTLKLRFSSINKKRKER